MSYFKQEEEKWDALPLGEKLAAWGLTEGARNAVWAMIDGYTNQKGVHLAGSGDKVDEIMVNREFMHQQIALFITPANTFPRHQNLLEAHRASSIILK